MLKSRKPVKDICIKKEIRFTQYLIRCQGHEDKSKNLVDGLNILPAMIKNRGCLKFIPFVDAIISTDLRGIITDI